MCAAATASKPGENCTGENVKKLRWRRTPPPPTVQISDGQIALSSPRAPRNSLSQPLQGGELPPALLVQDDSEVAPKNRAEHAG